MTSISRPLTTDALPLFLLSHPTAHSMNLLSAFRLSVIAMMGLAVYPLAAQDKSVIRPTELTRREGLNQDQPKARAQCIDFATSQDPLRDLQSDAMKCEDCEVIHWGDRVGSYSSWIQHSNRLIPVYTFGITLDSWRKRGSLYADAERLKELYGSVPLKSLNPIANYYDQTDIYHLQKTAVDAGYTNIILIVFDGMDWQTTRAAAAYLNPDASSFRSDRPYASGRGSGLPFLDDRRTKTDMGFVVTSAYMDSAKYDVDIQKVLNVKKPTTAGYDPNRGGAAPWLEKSRLNYLIGRDRTMPHTVTDSSASATSLCSGIKTYNASINVAIDGSPVVPIGRDLQINNDFRVGVVTSVPVSHATPAAAYANNVTRNDYQDLARDMVGLPSSFHREDPLPGVDVLIGAGWGEGKKSDQSQGQNYATGNSYFHEDDRRKIDLQNGGKYVVVERAKGKTGKERLMEAAQKAVDQSSRLMGFFGTKGGHLPFQTADGNYDPTFDKKGTEKYSKEDIAENPTLADMTDAALLVLEQSHDGFWLMIEAGDVDWANHANNIDNSVGAVGSGAAAFERVMNWVDINRAWDHTAVIVTADHGHYLVIDAEKRLLEAGRRGQQIQAEKRKQAN
jgi:alkaline phosphatase